MYSLDLAPLHLFRRTLTTATIANKLGGGWVYEPLIPTASVDEGVQPGQLICHLYQITYALIRPFHDI